MCVCVGGVCGPPAYLHRPTCLILEGSWLFLDGRLYRPIRPVTRSHYFFNRFFCFLILLVSNDFCFVYILLIRIFHFWLFSLHSRVLFLVSLLSSVCVCVWRWGVGRSVMDINFSEHAEIYGFLKLPIFIYSMWLSICVYNPDSSPKHFPKV